MSPLLVLHILAVGIWLGVIGAELFIEFDAVTDDASHIKASKLHFLTDIWVEIPAFLTVGVTGLLMLNDSHLQGLFLLKIIFGLLAIVFNWVCVVAVYRRRKFAMRGDIAGMKTTDPLMRLGGAGFIPCFIIAIALAIYSLIQ